MDYESIHFSQKERRRFLEIANGDTQASNTPEEDALFRKGLVKESMMVFADLDSKSSTADKRAVVLSDLGREYYAQHRNQQRKRILESWQFWLTTLIAVVSLIVSILK